MRQFKPSHLKIYIQPSILLTTHRCKRDRNIPSRVVRLVKQPYRVDRRTSDAAASGKNITHVVDICFTIHTISSFTSYKDFYKSKD